MGVALVGMSSAVDHGPHVALQVTTHRTRGCQLLRHISRLQLFNADFTAVRPRCANFCGIPHVELTGLHAFSADHPPKSASDPNRTWRIGLLNHLAGANLA